MNIIEVTDLSHRFTDGTRALCGVNLIVRAGEFVIVAGPNGSGKTTLFRHFNGLLHPGKGKVVVDGVPVKTDVKRARQRVGMVFQDADSQIVGETVYDDVAFGPENLCLKRSEVDRRVTGALKTVGLNRLANRRPDFLSGGEKRRLAVAGVLAMKPRVIVFDEPFTHLDYSGVCQVTAQMQALHDSGHTLLVATHDLEKVMDHANRLVILLDGCIVEDGPVDEILPAVESYGVRAPCTCRLGVGATS